jgi:hypothetical protein
MTRTGHRAVEIPQQSDHVAALTIDFIRAQRERTFRSAARPIASLHGSLKAAKCFLTHSMIRPAPGLNTARRSWHVRFTSNSV